MLPEVLIGSFVAFRARKKGSCSVVAGFGDKAAEAALHYEGTSPTQYISIYSI